MADPSISERVIRPKHGFVPIDFQELWRYRELFLFLAWRDILIRYKQTAIGIAWADIFNISTENLILEKHLMEKTV